MARTTVERGTIFLGTSGDQNPSGAHIKFELADGSEIAIDKISDAPRWRVDYPDGLSIRVDTSVRPNVAEFRKV